jgi:2'-5' RNA ligase
MGKLNIDGVEEKTFYIVVESPELVAIRQEIQNLFLLKGGNEKDFVAENFYPHITIGYTKRDLHDEDGIIKDAKSCISKISLSE